MSLGDRLNQYLSALEADAKKAKVKFTSSVDQTSYRWIGAGQGRGQLFEQSGRIFFLEVVGNRKDSILQPFVKTRSSFRSGESLWSVYGLRINLEATLEKFKFLSGKTTLTLKWNKATVEAIRWGLAEQLLKNNSLADWAAQALEMKGGRMERCGQGWRLYRRALLKNEQAIVLLQPEENQIITVKCDSRLADRRPNWNWLV